MKRCVGPKSFALAILAHEFFGNLRKVKFDLWIELHKFVSLLNNLFSQVKFSISYFFQSFDNMHLFEIGINSFNIIAQILFLQGSNNRFQTLLINLPQYFLDHLSKKHILFELFLFQFTYLAMIINKFYLPSCHLGVTKIILLNPYIF